jgi:hypothetical protein
MPVSSPFRRTGSGDQSKGAASTPEKSHRYFNDIVPLSFEVGEVPFSEWATIRAGGGRHASSAGRAATCCASGRPAIRRLSKRQRTLATDNK